MAGALVAYVSASIAGAKDKELQDFLPRWNGAQESTDDLVAALKRFATKQRGG